MPPVRRTAPRIADAAAVAEDDAAAVAEDDAAAVAEDDSRSRAVAEDDAAAVAEDDAAAVAEDDAAQASDDDPARAVTSVTGPEGAGAGTPTSREPVAGAGSAEQADTIPSDFPPVHSGAEPR